MSPHDSLAVHPDPSERSPTLPSNSGVCVRQIENEQQSTVGEVSQPLKVMALARRLAGPDNAVRSLPGSDSWLSKKKQKNPRLVPARLGAVKLHFRCCRNILDVGLVTRLWLCLTVTVLSVRSTHDPCTVNYRYNVIRYNVIHGYYVIPLRGPAELHLKCIHVTTDIT